MGIPFKKTKDGITIEVKVEPRSSRAEIRGVMGSVLKVKLKSAPVDGAANRQLIELLSKEHGLVQTEQDEVLKNLIEDRDYTRWGVVNAVTKVANSEAVSYDRASDLESLGGKLIDITNANWKRIAEAVPVAVAA